VVQCLVDETTSAACVNPRSQRPNPFPVLFQEQLSFVPRIHRPLASAGEATIRHPHHRRYSRSKLLPALGHFEHTGWPGTYFRRKILDHVTNVKLASHHTTPLASAI